ncbi:MAG: HAMP domain-containing histidine kinase [Burkholderiales bacterium]|nr:HAMP domain-containing histidine kinase [Burkholderiales bacterium]
MRATGATGATAATRATRINQNCVLRRNVETQPYGRCSVCSLQLKQCHAWQSNGYSFGLVVLTLALLLVPPGWPQTLVGAALLGVVVWQGLVNHKRTDELIHGQHRLMALTQELRGKQLVIEQQNTNLAAEVQARTAELREANMRLAAANLELIELDKLRSAMLSNVSHELRTPLTGILGSAQNLRDGIAGGLTQAQHEYVEMIESDSGRLIRVVNELLEWSRLQSGHGHVQRASLALQPLVDDVFMLLRPAAERKGVRLEFIASAASTIEGDADKLKQILINLVDNAIKFSPAGAAVQLRAEQGPGGLRLCIADQGPGIDPEDAPHIFERFFRGHASDGTSGSGLGLAIARNLARLHGGDLTLQPPSARERGSIFTLCLPAAGVA